MENIENKDMVSVVVPIYNQEKYLDRSIPSIINQSYKKLEILLVNDGSTDTSLDIIKRYSKMDSRIKVIEKTNGGLVDATIAGIKHATGEYIAFLDPDDKWGKEFLEVLINEMCPQYDFVTAGIYYENRDQLSIFQLKEDHEFDIEDIKWLRQHYLLGENSSLPSNIIYHARWNKIYRKSCIDKFVDEFGEYRDITLGEDSIFTYLMLCNCSGGKSLSKVNTYYYNIGNQNSMMNTDSVNQYMKKINILYKRYYNLMKKHGDEPTQAYMLYYMLIISFIEKNKGNKKNFIYIYNIVKKEELYGKILTYFIKKEKNIKRKIALCLRKMINSPQIYLKIFSK